MLALNSLGPQQTSRRELDSVVIPHRDCPLPITLDSQASSCW